MSERNFLVERIDKMISDMTDQRKLRCIYWFVKSISA